MWLIPSPLFPSSLDVRALDWDLRLQSKAFEQSVTSSGSSRLARYWLREWQKGLSPSLRYLRTCDPSRADAIVAEWISSLAGINGKRSGLFHDYIRIVEEAQPDFIFWENVGGVLSSLTLHHRPEILGHFDEVLAAAEDSPKGRWYAQCHVDRLHRRLLPIHGISALLYVQSSMGAVGYESEAGFFTAAEVGASHKRERVFVLGWRRDLADSARRRFRELWQSSWREGVPHGRDEGLAEPSNLGHKRESGGGREARIGTEHESVNLVDASRDERSGGEREAGARRGVCEAGDKLGNAAGDDERRYSMSGVAGERIPAGGSSGDIRESVGQADAKRPRRSETGGRRQIDTGSKSPAGRGSMGTVCQADAGNGLVSESERRPEGRDGTGPAGEVLGDANDSGSQGRIECRHCADKRIARETGNSGPVGQAHADIEHGDRCGNRGPGRRGESSDLSGQLADTEREPRSTEQFEREGERPDSAAADGSVLRVASTEVPVGQADAARSGCEARGSDGVRDRSGPELRPPACFSGEDIPLFALGPGATDIWQELLVQYPWLRPARSSAEALADVRGTLDGDALGLDLEDRTDRLRALGNMVQASQAAFALVVLARRSGLI